MTSIRRLTAIAATIGAATLLVSSVSSAPKRGFVADIEAVTEGNTDFRRVLYTGKKMQLVLMALAPGEDIGEEVHQDVDQFFRVEQGEGELRIDGVATRVKSDYAFIVPAGASHNVVNTGKEPLKLYTIYAPPEHRDGIVRATKAEAQAKEAHFDGKATE
jgi:mannose-6-phosphate isomerase-like protein (cupin superfamily)